MYTYFHNQSLPIEAPQGTNVWRTYKDIADFISQHNLLDVTIHVVYADWSDHTVEISPGLEYQKLIKDSPVAIYYYRGFAIKNDTERYTHIVSGPLTLLFAKQRIYLTEPSCFVMVYNEDENVLYVERGFASRYKGTVTNAKSYWQLPKNVEIKLEDNSFFAQYKISR